MARRAETIELAVLGLLHESPMHGYELRKHLIEEEAQSVTPVTRRPRIVYQLTPAGEREFTQLMSEVGPMALLSDRRRAQSEACERRAGGGSGGSGG